MVFSLHSHRRRTMQRMKFGSYVFIDNQQQKQQNKARAVCKSWRKCATEMKGIYSSGSRVVAHLSQKCSTCEFLTKQKLEEAHATKTWAGQHELESAVSPKNNKPWSLRMTRTPSFCQYCKTFGPLNGMEQQTNWTQGWHTRLSGSLLK